MRGDIVFSLEEVKDMTVLKRSLLSMKRHWLRTLLLFLIVLLLTTGVASAISVRVAVVNVDEALRARLPAIASIHLDQATLNDPNLSLADFEERTPLTSEIIHEIGELPYVRMFDYALWGYNFFNLALIPVTRAGEVELDTTRLLGAFMLRGIHYHHVMEIEAGLIELIGGRVFTEDEVRAGASVTIVSQAFLNENGLVIGDTIPLTYRIYDEEAMADSGILSGVLDEDYLLGEKPFELEIIGSFNQELEEGLYGFEILNHLRLLNQFYVPNLLLESTFDLYIETFLEIDPDLAELLQSADFREELIQYENIIFMMHDPLYLENFKQESALLLPSFWIASDLSNSYADFASSMDMLNDVFLFVMIATIVASLIVITLLALLTLRERKKEVGIYLALGERKRNIFYQLLIEMILPSIIAITLALFIGNHLSASISELMIREDLVRQAEEDDGFFSIEFGTLESLGFRHEISHDEMLELYEIRLDTTMTVYFYTIGLGVVLISTTIPIFRLLALKPKNILMGGSIG